MRNLIIPVILCAAASWLWPASRQVCPKVYPKHLFAFSGKHSLLQETLFRVDRHEFAQPAIVTGNDCLFVVPEQMRAFGAGTKT